VIVGGECIALCCAPWCAQKAVGEIKGTLSPILAKSFERDWREGVDLIADVCTTYKDFHEIAKLNPHSQAELEKQIIDHVVRDPNMRRA
jgi:hypothetical protein